MKLGPIVLKLRLQNTRFRENIAGAAELAIAMRDTLAKECAFVIPLSESSNTNLYDNVINQEIVERFAVVVAIKNDLVKKEKTGLTSFDILDTVRAELFKGILGWQMEDMSSITYYKGGSLLDINPAWLWYQYEFEASRKIGQDDGVDEGYTDKLYSLYTQVKTWDDGKFPYIGDLPVTIWGPDMTTLVDVGAFSIDFDFDEYH